MTDEAIYRVWTMYEVEGVKDEDEARYWAEQRRAAGEEPTVAYVERAD